MQVYLQLDPTFPLHDIETIGAQLLASGALVPGYIPPESGLLSVRALIYAKTVQNLETVILPDLNLVSRMASVAEKGIIQTVDEPTQIAIEIMAFAQANNLLVEPSIAFHELAHSEGNAVAHEKLCWFRKADFAQPKSWIDLALGRNTQLKSPAEVEVGKEDLALPLNRWTRNYVVALEVAKLELSSLSPIQRCLRLLDWMEKDFFVAGPASIFSSMYLSPKAERKRTMKGLRSTDREKAIKGIMNAAWDITHLSDFARRSQHCSKENRRYIFATADKKLAEIAPILMIDLSSDRRQELLCDELKKWWSSNDLDALTKKLLRNLDVAESRQLAEFSNSEIQKRVECGELFVRNWNLR